MRFCDGWRGPSILTVLLLLCSGAFAAGTVEFPERTQMDIAAWDAYAMALSAGGSEGYELLVWSVAIGGPAGRNAAEQLISSEPTGADLEHVISVVKEHWKRAPEDHRLPVLALDLAARGGGSPQIPEIWQALAEAGEKSGVAQGELWKLWTCGIANCFCGYASPAFYERLMKLLKDGNAPMEFRTEMAILALSACEKAIVFRQLEGTEPALERRTLETLRTFLGERLADGSDRDPVSRERVIAALAEHGGEGILRGICRDPKKNIAVRVLCAERIGEIGVFDDPALKAKCRPAAIRRFRISALIRSGRFAEAEALLQDEEPRFRTLRTVEIAQRQGNYRKAIQLLKADRGTLEWECYCSEMLRNVHMSKDRAAFRELEAENERRCKEAGHPVPEESFNNFFYVALELGLYDGKLTPKLLEKLENLPRSAATLDTFAWALYRSGAYRRAEEAILPALRLADMRDISVILEHAGDVASALGKWQTAERCYRLALANDRRTTSELSPDCAKKLREALRKSKIPAAAPKGGTR